MKTSQTILVAIFTASLIASNLLGSKLVDVFGITVSVGFFVFPFTFIALDILTEVFGKKAAQKTVAAGIAIQVYVLGFVYLGRWLPPSPHREIKDAYEIMFALTPRMVLASIVAYSVSQFFDVYVFAQLKSRFPSGRLILRVNAASWAAQWVDTAIFSGIFLGGTLGFSEWWKSFLLGYFTKMALATCDSPLVNLGVWLIRRLDGQGEAQLSVQSIHTEVFSSGHDLHAFLKRHLQGHLKEGAVVAVTSKIVSIAEGRTLPCGSLTKKEVIRQEADQYLGMGGHGIELTIKNGLLIPSAGIDESNSETGDYILYPKDPFASAEKIGRYLRREFGLKNLGVILTDSHSMPLRRGVTGISLAHWGLKATRSLVGAPDIFGRALKFTSVDVVDSLAAMAVYAMGEANERAPLAVIFGANAEFTERSSPDEIVLSLDEDLYGPLLKPAVMEEVE